MQALFDELPITSACNAIVQAIRAAQATQKAVQTPQIDQQALTNVQTPAVVSPKAD